MLPILLWILVFITSIVALIKGSDWFTKAAEGLSQRLKISPYIIGVTVVSIGTSLPELASSITAVIQHQGDIVAGNVIGSNIANSLLVLGVGAIVAGKLRTKWDLRKVDFPLLFGGTFLLFLMSLNGTFSRIEALFMLFGLGVYLHYLYRQHKNGAFDEEISKGGLTDHPWIITALLFIGTLFIIVGAKYTVESVVHIASLTGFSTGVIATTAVALGTSLPELMVTIMAGLHGKYELAIGNVMGSNLFNIFGIMGISGLIGPILVGPQLLKLALPVLIGATFMFYFVMSDKNISRWEGWTLVLLYVFFIARIITV